MTPPDPRVLNQVHHEALQRGYSPRTGAAYRDWARRYMRFHGGQHPRALAEAEATTFLDHLAAERGLSPSTLNQATSALLFLYRHVLPEPAPWARALQRPRTHRRLPAAPSAAEVRAILTRLADPYRLQVSLMLGAGLRLRECLRLRVSDLDFDTDRITVQSGKGSRGRATCLPAPLVPALREQLRRARITCEAADNIPSSESQWLFPGARRSVDPNTGAMRRHHLHHTALQRRLKRAVLQAGIPRPVTCHGFRHGFAFQQLRAGHDLGTVAERMGHSDLRTAILYREVLALEAAGDAHDRAA